MSANVSANTSRRLQLGGITTPDTGDIPNTDGLGEAAGNIGEAADDASGGLASGGISTVGGAVGGAFLPAECANVTIDASTPLHLRQLCSNTTHAGGPRAADSADVLCAAEQTTDFILKTNMSNPAEHCDIAYTPDMCAKEGGVLHYSIRLAEAPDTDVKLLISSKDLQHVTTTITTEDWSEPHYVTLHLHEDIIIGGHHWMLVHHQFESIVLEEASNSTAVSDPFTSWSHARVPFGNADRDRTAKNTIGTNVTAWLGGKLYSSTTQSLRPLAMPVLIRDNDEVKVDPVIGEYGRKWRLSSRVAAGQPAW